jgi:hypothetical protein
MKTTSLAPQPLASFADLDERRFWIDDTSGQIRDGSRRPQWVERSASVHSPATFLTQLSFRFATRQRNERFVASGRAVCACSNVQRETDLLARGGEPCPPIE